MERFEKGRRTKRNGVRSQREERESEGREKERKERKKMERNLGRECVMARCKQTEIIHT